MQMTILDSQNLKSFQPIFDKIINAKGFPFAIFGFFYISALIFIKSSCLNNVYNRFKAMKTIFVFSCVIMQARFIYLYFSQFSSTKISPILVFLMVFLLLSYFLLVTLCSFIARLMINTLIKKKVDNDELLISLFALMAWSLAFSAIINSIFPYVGLAIANSISQFIFMILTVDRVGVHLETFKDYNGGIAGLKTACDLIELLVKDSKMHLSNWREHLKSSEKHEFGDQIFNKLNDLHVKLDSEFRWTRFKIENMSVISRIKNFFTSGDTFSIIFDDLKDIRNRSETILAEIKAEARKIIPEQ